MCEKTHAACVLLPGCRRPASETSQCVGSHRKRSVVLFGPLSLPSFRRCGELSSPVGRAVDAATRRAYQRVTCGRTPSRWNADPSRTRQLDALADVGLSMLGALGSVILGARVPHTAGRLAQIQPRGHGCPGRRICCRRLANEPPRIGLALRRNERRPTELGDKKAIDRVWRFGCMSPRECWFPARAPFRCILGRPTAL